MLWRCIFWIDYNISISRWCTIFANEYSSYLITSWLIVPSLIRTTFKMKSHLFGVLFSAHAENRTPRVINCIYINLTYSVSSHSISLDISYVVRVCLCLFLSDVSWSSLYISQRCQCLSMSLSLSKDLLSSLSSPVSKPLLCLRL